MEHLQTEHPALSWEQWFSELVSHFADALKIDKIAASRHVNIENAMEWYEDGFAPYATFRETFNQ